MPDKNDPKEPGNDARQNRRDVFAKIGVGACCTALAGAGLVTFDFLEPKVLFEPPSRFSAGTAAEYPEGTVRLHKEQKTFVVGGAAGVWAMSAVCTHLGCIARFHSDEGVIACPCHGSRFDLEGNVLHGPAPRPLQWLEVTVDADGQLVVDTAVIIPRGKVIKA